MSNRRLAAGIIFLLIAQFCVAQAAPSKTDVEKRVDSILSKMTQEEKITINRRDQRRALLSLIE
jgi:hypothetical protein